MTFVEWVDEQIEALDVDAWVFHDFWCQVAMAIVLEMVCDIRDKLADDASAEAAFLALDDMIVAVER